MDTNSPNSGAAGGSFEDEDGTVLSSDEVECPDWLHELEDQSRYEGEVRSRSAAMPATVPCVSLRRLCLPVRNA